jgi:hypothetical protein
MLADVSAEGCSFGIDESWFPAFAGMTERRGSGENAIPTHLRSRSTFCQSSGMYGRHTQPEGLHDQVREWCQGRAWWARIPILLWLGYLLVRLLGNPAHQSVFNPLDLGIHELGHIIFAPLGQFMGILGGSLTQCLVPALSPLMFYRQRDFFAMAFCLGWLGLNLFDVSVYVADARAQRLFLVSPFGGDPLHDWHYLLGRMGLLRYDHAIAVLLRVVGTASMAAFLLVGAYLCWLMATTRRS